MQEARPDQPARTGFEPIGFGKIQNAIVAAIPIRETLFNLLFGCTRFQPHEGVREIISHGVVLWRKIVTLRLTLLTHQFGMRGRLMHMVRNWTHVIEEFRVYRPATIFFPDCFPDESWAEFLNGRGKGETVVCKHAITQAFVWRPIFVRGRRGRSKPAFINAAAVKTVGVDIIRMKLE